MGRYEKLEQLFEAASDVAKFYHDDGSFRRLSEEPSHLKCRETHERLVMAVGAVRDSECVGAKEKPDVPELPEVPPVMAVPSWDNYPPEFPTPKSLGQWISMLVRKVNAITDYLRAKEQRCATCRHIKKWCNCDAEPIPDVPEKMPPQSGMAYRLIDDRYNELREVVAALKRREEVKGD